MDLKGFLGALFGVSAIVSQNNLNPNPNPTVTKYLPGKHGPVAIKVKAPTSIDEFINSLTKVVAEAKVEENVKSVPGPNPYNGQKQKTKGKGR